MANINEEIRRSTGPGSKRFVCQCGQPATAGVVHRRDMPCYRWDASGSFDMERCARPDEPWLDRYMSLVNALAAKVSLMLQFPKQDELATLGQQIEVDNLIEALKAHGRKR
jgi:hypothetical protein